MAQNSNPEAPTVPRGIVLHNDEGPEPDESIYCTCEESSLCFTDVCPCHVGGYCCTKDCCCEECPNYLPVEFEDETDHKAPALPGDVILHHGKGPMPDGSSYCVCQEALLCFTELCSCYSAGYCCTKDCSCEGCANYFCDESGVETVYKEPIPQYILEKRAWKCCCCRESECLKIERQCCACEDCCTKLCQCERCLNKGSSVSEGEINREVMDKFQGLAIEQKPSGADSS